MVRFDCQVDHYMCEIYALGWFIDHNTCPYCRYIFNRKRSNIFSKIRKGQHFLNHWCIVYRSFILHRKKVIKCKIIKLNIMIKRFNKNVHDCLILIKNNKY